MPRSFACARPGPAASRRSILSLIAGACAPLCLPHLVRAGEASRELREITIGLTPVVLNDDLALLAALKSYFEASIERTVKLVMRRTYEDITTLLVSGQLDAAWICGYPYVAFRDRLELMAAPVWRGKPLYQAYVIAGVNSRVAAIEDLRGTAHAFSDPNSNSGYLVTAAYLAERGFRPEGFFSRVFFTYGHRNVVRAVAVGLAESGSVDGYVWEVMAAAEPELTRMTRVIRRSEPLGFPPIATMRGGLAHPEVSALQRAFIMMAESPEGRQLLQLLQLDGFTQVPPELFDTIAAKAALVRRLG